MTKFSYGAVDPENYDEKDMRFLEGPKLTSEQKIRKCLLVAVPILAAVMIVGGAALFLLRDFDTLYPGHHSRGKEPAIRTGHLNSPAEENAPSPVAANDAQRKDSSDVASSCLAYEKCAGLIGECCPTSDGSFLNCCH